MKIVENRFWSDWDSILTPKQVNWNNFTLVNLEGEYDPRFGNVELNAALLGFHYRLTVKVNSGDTEFQDYLHDMVEKLEAGTLETVPFPDNEDF